MSNASPVLHSSALQLCPPDMAAILVTSEPLRGNTPSIEINGKRVGSIGVDQPYKASLEPGKTTVSIKGDKVEFNAEPNKEYVFEVAMREPSGASVFFFGLVLSRWRKKRNS